MHDLQYQLIAFRGVERLLAVLIAAFLIWLGYRLFTLGILTEQKGEIKNSLLSVRLQSVAPGTCFALLGCVVVLYGISTQLHLDNDGKGNVLYFGQSAAEDKHEKTIGTYSIDERAAKHFLPALNYFIGKNDLWMTSIETDDHLVHMQNLQKLKAFRDGLIIDFSGIDSKLFNEAISSIENNRDQSSLSKETIQAVNAISPWLN